MRLTVLPDQKIQGRDSREFTSPQLDQGQPHSVGNSGAGLPGEDGKNPEV